MRELSVESPAFWRNKRQEFPPLPVLRERLGVRGEGEAERGRRGASARQSHPHRNLLPAQREKGPDVTAASTAPGIRTSALRAHRVQVSKMKPRRRTRAVIVAVLVAIATGAL